MKQNTTIIMKTHIKSQRHQENVKEFAMNPLDFLHAERKDLTYDNFVALIRKSVINEGKMQF